MHLKPSPTVRSAIEIEVVDGYDHDIDTTEDDPYRAIREAWDGERLRVTDGEALFWSLTDLSNYFDDLANHPPHDMVPSERTLAARVVRGIATMLDKLRPTLAERG